MVNSEYRSLWRQVYAVAAGADMMNCPTAPTLSIYAYIRSRVTRRQVPPEWSRLTNADVNYEVRGGPGNKPMCFQEAIKYIERHRELPNMQFVNGIIINPLTGEPVCHGWVEIGDDVLFDGVVHKFLDRESYYRHVAAEAYCRYDATERSGDTG